MYTCSGTNVHCIAITIIYVNQMNGKHASVSHIKSILNKSYLKIVTGCNNVQYYVCISHV